jgi:hypothetical protein
MTDANTHYRRAHEQSEVDADKRKARIDELTALRFGMLKSSYGDWMEALREITWMESERHLLAHHGATHGSDDMCGMQLCTLIDAELMRQAEEWAEDEWEKGR